MLKRSASRREQKAEIKRVKNVVRINMNIYR